MKKIYSIVVMNIFAEYFSTFPTCNVYGISAKYLEKLVQKEFTCHLNILTKYLGAWFEHTV